VSGRRARLAVPVALAAMIIGSVPGLLPGRALDQVGLSQSWGVFAPRPDSAQISLSADVRFADGSSATWRPPRFGAALALLGYHWQTWTLNVVRDQDSQLWEPAARWIASHGGWGTRRVVSVTLRRSWTDVPAPGARSPPPVGNEFDFYTLNVDRRGG
jgi:hypothetical protein